MLLDALFFLFDCFDLVRDWCFVGIVCWALSDVFVFTLPLFVYVLLLMGLVLNEVGCLRYLLAWVLFACG